MFRHAFCRRHADAYATATMSPPLSMLPPRRRRRHEVTTPQLSIIAATFFFSSRRYHFFDAPLVVVICRHCSLRFTPPMPADGWQNGRPRATPHYAPMRLDISHAY